MKKRQVMYCKYYSIGVAQLVERQANRLKVAGAIPATMGVLYKYNRTVYQMQIKDFLAMCHCSGILALDVKKA
jgi:hypothetical protein